jgi:hypothetical protein
MRYDAMSRCFEVAITSRTRIHTYASPHTTRRHARKHCAGLLKSCIGAIAHTTHAYNTRMDAFMQQARIRECAIEERRTDAAMLAYTHTCLLHAYNTSILIHAHNTHAWMHMIIATRTTLTTHIIRTMHACMDAHARRRVHVRTREYVPASHVSAVSAQLRTHAFFLAVIRAFMHCCSLAQHVPHAPHAFYLPRTTRTTRFIPRTTRTTRTTARWHLQIYERCAM